MVKIFTLLPSTSAAKPTDGHKDSEDTLPGWLSIKLQSISTPELIYKVSKLLSNSFQDIDFSVECNLQCKEGLRGPEDFQARIT